MIDADVNRIYSQAVGRAISHIGGPSVWELLQAKVRKALVAQQILAILSAQDEDIPSVRVRELVNLLSAALEQMFD